MIELPVPNRPPARRTELLISGILRGGVLLSVVLILAGVVVTFAHHPDYLTSSARLDGLLRSDPSFPTTIGGVVRGLAALQGRSLVSLGLLVLISTPVARVAVSIAAFVELRDRTFALLTSVVLLLLLFALFLGKAA